MVMFFATSSRNFSWITQKLHTAMSWTELLYSSATARSARGSSPTEYRTRVIVGTNTHCFSA